MFKCKIDCCPVCNKLTNVLPQGKQGLVESIRLECQTGCRRTTILDNPCVITDPTFKLANMVWAEVALRETSYWKFRFNLNNMEGISDRIVVILSYLQLADIDKKEIDTTCKKS